MTISRFLGALAAASVVTLTACGTPTTASPQATTTTASATFAVGTIATGLDHPSGMGFLPDGSLLFTQRGKNQVFHLAPGSAPTAVGTIPGMVADADDAALALAVSPSYATDHAVYLFVSTHGGDRVLRMVGEPATGLTHDKVIVDGIPRSTANVGGALAFGPGGQLYVATGDADAGAQNRASKAGKTYRVNPDGTGLTQHSIGHRGVRGMTWDATGALLATEPGQKSADEINVITADGNYGWPKVEGTGGNEWGYIDPVATFAPTATCAPSGVAFVKDSLYVGCLSGKRLVRLPWDGQKAGAPVDVRTDLGRVGSVVATPQGQVLVATDNGGNDSLVVLAPA